MKSTMDRDAHHAAVQRALALGRSADPAALPELAALLATPSAEVRRLAASAIGKLSGFGADPATAVQALAPIALRDPHPQTQQYALKALKTIEYWGMDTLDYQIGMLEKKKLYQQAGKRLISFYRHEKADLPHLLHERLSRYLRIGERSEAAITQGEATP